MPRVTEQYRANRRAEIVLAASRLFAAKGFHTTSMADIMAAANLSAGAVYGYFSSKEEIIGAVAENALQAADATFVRLMADDAVPSPAQAVMTVIESMVLQANDVPGTDQNAGRIALQVWAEALSNPDLNVRAHQAFERLCTRYTLVARTWQNAGHLPGTAVPEEVAIVMLGLTQGFLLQHLLFEVDLPAYSAGVHALLDTATGKPDLG